MSGYETKSCAGFPFWAHPAHNDKHYRLISIIIGTMLNTYKKMLAHWSLPLLITVTCVVIQLVDGSEMLRFDRSLIDDEPWRVVSGHLVHLGWNHLLLNLAGFVLIWALFGHLLRGWAWSIAFAVSALAVSGGLYLLNSGLAWYVGLSGVLHGLLVLGAIASLHSERRLALSLLVIVAVKLVWEQLSGDSATSGIVGGDVVVNSHLYGALAGLLCAPLIRIGRSHQ